MMDEETTTEIGQLDLPYGRKAGLKEVRYENGMSLLRLTLRENRRFTIVDLDAARAENLGQMLIDWAAATGSPDNE